MQTQPTPPLPQLHRRLKVGGFARSWALLAVLALLAPQFEARPAHAQASKDELAKAEAKALQAKFKFKAEAYAEAAELFLEAFTISKSPALLFNAARAFEEARRYKEARAAFEQYLSLSSISDAGRADARAHIASCDAKIAETDKTAPTSGSAGGSAGSTATPPGSGKAPSSGPNGQAEPSQADPSPIAPAPGRSTPGMAASAGVASGSATPERPSKLLTWSLIGGGGFLVLLSAAAISGSISKANDANAMDFSVADAKHIYNTKFNEAESGVAGGSLFLLAGAGLTGWGLWRLLHAPASTTTASTPMFWGAPTALASDRGLTGGVALGGSF